MGTDQYQVGWSDRLALVIATGLGIGYFPVAPGTVGSLLGVALLLGLSWFELKGEPRLLFHLVVVAVISIVGIWAASRAEIHFKRKDPPQVVIDEVVGQLLTFGLIFRNPRLVLLILGFILFRVFDIWKPFPIRKLEGAPLGFGIVLDDLAAGFYASLVILGVHVFWPTLT